MAQQDTPTSAGVVFIADGQFEAAAQELNKAADELTAAVALFETYIERQNVGVPCWVRVKGWAEDNGEYWHRDLGYERFGHAWSIAIREIKGHEASPEHAETTCWPFRDAPRKTRISAVEKLPALMHELTKEARKTSRRLSESAASTKALAIALGVAAVPKSKK